jgi:formylglycine-generating enzyme required for sulfatase activity
VGDESHSDSGRAARSLQFCWSAWYEQFGAVAQESEILKTVDISRNPSAQVLNRRRVRHASACATLLVAVFLLFPPILLAQRASQADAQSDRRITIVTDDAPVNKLPERAKRWALLIGIDEYQDLNISRLYGAANDVRAMRTVLTKGAGFPEEQVVMLATGEPTGLQPTRSNILSKLSNLLAMTPKDGLFLLEFSGHGIERRNRPFLLPADAALSDDPELLEQLAISVEWLKRAIEARGIAQVVVLLDACRNEPGGRANADNPLTQNLVDGFSFKRRNEGVQAFATLFATERGKRAWEDSVRKRGYFSLALEEGLNGEAANQAGEVTLSSLLQYLQDRVPLRVARDLGADKQQRPYAQIEGYRANDLVLAIAPKTEPRIREQGMCEAAWEMVKDSARVGDLEAFIREFPDCQIASLARIKLARLRPERRVNESSSNETNPEVDRVSPRDAVISFYGITVEDLAGETRAVIGLDDGAQGVFVRFVDATGVAAAAGIQARDLITSVDNVQIRSLDEFQHLLINATNQRLLLGIRRQSSATGALNLFLTVERPPDIGPEEALNSPPGLETMPPSTNPRAQAGERTAPLRLDGSVLMEFVSIPAGTFLMGCSGGDSECAPDELPRRQVQITKPFELGRYEVTQEEWSAVMGSNPSRFRDGRRPVEHVSWVDVQSFLGKLNARNDGYRYRLPTEAEWEYAARAGTDGKRYAEAEVIGWYRENSDAKTQLVGGKQANAWGLHDMLGNVWEWCADWYQEKSYAVASGRDPHGPNSGEYRVLRGGTWGEGASAMRASKRFWMSPSVGNFYVGFRVVREAR